MLIKVLSVLASYLLGSFNAALIVGKVFYNKDIWITKLMQAQPSASHLWQSCGSGACHGHLKEFWRAAGQLLTGNIEILDGQSLIWPLQL